jgi:hypothetical protein
MKWLIATVVAAVTLVLAGWVAAGSWTIQKQERGAAEMILEGGKTGAVPFPHKAHQDATEACEACHDLFPQKEGAIVSLQESGALKRKAVMKQCQRCHRKAKREGRPSGPIGCKDCHSVKG